MPPKKNIKVFKVQSKKKLSALTKRPIEQALTQRFLKNCKINKEGTENFLKDNEEISPEILAIAFSYACQHQDNRIALSIIEHKKFDINRTDIRPDETFINPLHNACQHQNLELVRILIADPKIDINIRNHETLTPLMYSINLAKSLMENHLAEHSAILIDICIALILHEKTELSMKDLSESSNCDATAYLIALLLSMNDKKPSEHLISKINTAFYFLFNKHPSFKEYHKLTAELFDDAVKTKMDLIENLYILLMSTINNSNDPIDTQFLSLFLENTNGPTEDSSILERTPTPNFIAIAILKKDAVFITKIHTILLKKPAYLENKKNAERHIAIIEKFKTLEPYENNTPIRDEIDKLSKILSSIIKLIGTLNESVEKLSTFNADELQNITITTFVNEKINFIYQQLKYIDIFDKALNSSLEFLAKEYGSSPLLDLKLLLVDLIVEKNDELISIIKLIAEERNELALTHIARISHDKKEILLYEMLSFACAFNNLEIAETLINTGVPPTDMLEYALHHQNLILAYAIINSPQFEINRQNSQGATPFIQTLNYLAGTGNFSFIFVAITLVGNKNIDFTIAPRSLLDCLNNFSKVALQQNDYTNEIYEFAEELFSALATQKEHIRDVALGKDIIEQCTRIGTAAEKKRAHALKKDTHGAQEKTILVDIENNKIEAVKNKIIEMTYGKITGASKKEAIDLLHLVFYYALKSKNDNLSFFIFNNSYFNINYNGISTIKYSEDNIGLHINPFHNAFLFKNFLIFNKLMLNKNTNINALDGNGNTLLMNLLHDAKHHANLQAHLETIYTLLKHDAIDVSAKGENQQHSTWSLLVDFIVNLENKVLSEVTLFNIHQILCMLLEKHTDFNHNNKLMALIIPREPRSYFDLIKTLYIIGRYKIEKLENEDFNFLKLTSWQLIFSKESLEENGAITKLSTEDILAISLLKKDAELFILMSGLFILSNHNVEGLIEIDSKLKYLQTLKDAFGSSNLDIKNKVEPENSIKFLDSSLKSERQAIQAMEEIIHHAAFYTIDSTNKLENLNSLHNKVLENSSAIHEQLNKVVNFILNRKKVVISLGEMVVALCSYEMVTNFKKQFKGEFEAIKEDLNNFKIACEQNDSIFVKNFIEKHENYLNIRDNSNKTVLSILLSSATPYNAANYLDSVLFLLKKEAIDLNSKDNQNKTSFCYLSSFMTKVKDSINKETLFHFLYVFYKKSMLFNNNAHEKEIITKVILIEYKNAIKHCENDFFKLSTGPIDELLIYVLVLIQNNNKGKSKNIVETFIPRLDPTIRNDDLFLLFLTACVANNTLIAEHLLKKQIPMREALISSLINGNNTLSQGIIKHEKFDVNFKDVQGRTAAHLACGKLNFHILSLLLENPDIDLNPQIFNTGMTPLMFALDSYTLSSYTPSSSAALKITQELLKHSGKINFSLETQAGHTALSYLLSILEKIKDHESMEVKGQHFQRALDILKKIHRAMNNSDEPLSKDILVKLFSLVELPQKFQNKNIEKPITVKESQTKKQEIIDWIIEKIETITVVNKESKEEIEKLIAGDLSTKKHTEKTDDIILEYESIQLFLNSLRENLKQKKCNQKNIQSKLIFITDTIQKINKELETTKIVQNLINEAFRASNKIQELLKIDTDDSLKQAEEKIKILKDKFEDFKPKIENITKKHTSLIKDIQDFLTRNKDSFNDLRLEIPPQPACIKVLGLGEKITNKSSTRNKSNTRNNNKNLHKQSLFSANTKQCASQPQDKLRKVNITNIDEKCEEVTTSEKTLSLTVTSGDFSISPDHTLHNNAPVEKNDTSLEEAFPGSNQLDKDDQKEIIEEYSNMDEKYEDVTTSEALPLTVTSGDFNIFPHTTPSNAQIEENDTTLQEAYPGFNQLAEEDQKEIMEEYSNFKNDQSFDLKEFIQGWLDLFEFRVKMNVIYK